MRAVPLTVAMLSIVMTLGIACRAPDARVTPSYLVDAGATTTDTITPAMIALGERIFQGRTAGALCATCHGKNARGMAGLGPDLTDDTWLHGDGSMAFLQTIIRTGVMKPKEGAAVMPPYGGTPLQPEQLEAVAAYVYSLSHPAGG